jgi:hypothetical protein
MHDQLDCIGDKEEICKAAEKTFGKFAYSIDIYIFHPCPGRDTKFYILMKINTYSSPASPNPNPQYKFEY